MQTTKFSFELPNDRTDLIDIANFLVQKAKEIKPKFTYHQDEKNSLNYDRLEQFNKIIGLIDADISDEEADKIRAKRYEK